MEVQRPVRQSEGNEAGAMPMPRQPLFDFARSVMGTRERRVLLLIVGVIVLSVADLIITIAFLRANWMMEANPIAAYLIKTTQSAWALSIFKLVSVAVCVAMLLRVRSYLMGEIAAWCAVGILTVMSVMWHQYSRHIDEAHYLIIAQTTNSTTRPAAITFVDDHRLGLP